MALRGHALRLAQQMRDEAAIELRVVEIARSDAREKLSTFATQLNGLTTRAADLTDQCHATERRLRRELDERARQLSAELAQRCLASTQAEILDSGDLSPADIEQRGREVIEDVATQAVLGWRQTQAHELEQRLRGLTDAIENDRARQFEALRDAAMNELGVSITATVEPLPLHPGRLFWLDFAPAPVVELPGTQLLRRHGPGAARRARERALTDIPEVTDRQVGRARADLQERLAETIRQITAALKVHHADTLSRLQQALGRATEVREDDAPQVERDIDRLSNRASWIGDVVDRLNRAPSAPNAQPANLLDGAHGTQETDGGNGSRPAALAEPPHPG